MAKTHKHKQDDFNDVYNKSLLLENFNNDTDLICELCSIYLENHTKTLENIKISIGNNDAKKLEYFAHTLRGSAANFFANPTINTAEKLEKMGNQNNLTQAQETFEALILEAKKLEAALKDFIKNNQAK